MSGVNLYDRRPSVAFNLSLLPSFLSPIFNRNSSTNWSATERVRVRGGGGGAGEASKASNFIFVKKAGIEGGGWRQRQSDRPAARSVYYERRRGEGSLTRRPSAVRVRPFARSFPFGMKMRKGGNFGRSLVKSTKFGTHRSTLSVGWRQ